MRRDKRERVAEGTGKKTGEKEMDVITNDYEIYIYSFPLNAY